MKIKVCQKQLYTSQIAWPHLWAALMCLPNSSCLLSSCPCVSGDWTASGTLHAILYLTFTPPPNTSLMVTDQGDAICPDQSIPWPYKSLSKWQTIWNRAYILRQCQGQGQKWCAYRCTRGSAASWLISSSYSTSYYDSKITFLYKTKHIQLSSYFSLMMMMMTTTTKILTKKENFKMNDFTNITYLSLRKFF